MAIKYSARCASLNRTTPYYQKNVFWLPFSHLGRFRTWKLGKKKIGWKSTVGDERSPPTSLFVLKFLSSWTIFFAGFGIPLSSIDRRLPSDQAEKNHLRGIHWNRFFPSLPLFFWGFNQTEFSAVSRSFLFLSPVSLSVERRWKPVRLLSI